jgi:signal transduction histidine kinase
VSRSRRIEQIAKDIREMEGLTSALLERERIKGHTARPHRDNVDLVATANAVVSGFKGRGPGIELVESPESLVVTGDEALLKVLMQNVLDNALKFSLEDSAHAELRLREDEAGVSIIVDDDGTGIPTEMSNRVLEPFVKLDPSRGHRRGYGGIPTEMSNRVLEPFVKLDPSRGHRRGYGLGLNLCQRIVQAHAGDIRIEPREPRGTRVVITLPGPV